MQYKRCASITVSQLSLQMRRSLSETGEWGKAYRHATSKPIDEKFLKNPKNIPKETNPLLCAHYANHLIDKSADKRDTPELRSAIRWLERAAEIVPAALFNFLLYMNYSRIGDKKNAEKNLFLCVKLSPNNASFIHLRGLWHRQQKNMAAALHDFDRTLQLCPTYIFSYVEKAELFLEHSQYGEALEMTRKGLQVSESAFDHARTAYTVAVGPLTEYPYLCHVPVYEAHLGL